MSGSNNIPLAMLSPPPAIDEKAETPSLQATLRAAIYYEVVRSNAGQAIKDMHNERIKALRKELDYLKETEWKFSNIDKYIGQ